MSFCDDIKEDYSKVHCKVWNVPDDYKTPATDYTLEKKGKAELTREDYNKGLYLMEGVKNNDFFCLDKKLPVTSLKINKKTWMVDDPLHWEGMKKLAEKSYGKVLVGGLGLGLLPHALKKNDRVNDIKIIEKNKDVIDLIKPKIPDDIKIQQGDIFENIDASDCPDTILLDLWVRGEKDRQNVYPDMMKAFTDLYQTCPHSDIFIWGITDSNINPAVEKKPCEMLKKYKLGQSLG